MIDLSELEGAWIATVTWRSPDGRRLTESRSSSDRHDALVWAQELDRRHADAVRSELTVAQLVMNWHDERVPQLRDTTVAREECLLMKHVAGDPIGQLPARELTRRDAYNFGERLTLKENGRGGTLASKTRRHIQKAMRHGVDPESRTVVVGC